MRCIDANGKLTCANRLHSSGWRSCRECEQPFKSSNRQSESPVCPVWMPPAKQDIFEAVGKFVRYGLVSRCRQGMQACPRGACEAPLVSWTPALVSFCCLVSKSPPDFAFATKLYNAGYDSGILAGRWTAAHVFGFTKSHPRSLLSMAKLNSARSRWFSAISSRMRITQTCFGISGRLCPTTRPLFQARRHARMAGKFAMVMRVPPIRHDPPQRQPDLGNSG